MYLYVVCFAQQNKSHYIPTAGYSGQSFELVLQSTNDTLRCWLALIWPCAQLLEEEINGKLGRVFNL
jgi:hypothetical protein